MLAGDHGWPRVTAGTCPVSSHTAADDLRGGRETPDSLFLLRTPEPMTFSKEQTLVLSTAFLTLPRQGSPLTPVPSPHHSPPQAHRHGRALKGQPGSPPSQPRVNRWSGKEPLLLGSWPVPYKSWPHAPPCPFLKEEGGPHTPRCHLGIITDHLHSKGPSGYTAGLTMPDARGVPRPRTASSPRTLLITPLADRG